MNVNQITKTQLKNGYRGELYNGKDFVGGVYMIEGQGYVLDVEYGQVKRIIGVHAPKDFHHIGGMQLSAGRSEVRWSL